jgi:hypothetical protein
MLVDESINSYKYREQKQESTAVEEHGGFLIINEYFRKILEY